MNNTSSSDESSSESESLELSSFFGTTLEASTLVGFFELAFSSSEESSSSESSELELETGLAAFFTLPFLAGVFLAGAAAFGTGFCAQVNLT
jgi:hypothetical protein